MQKSVRIGACQTPEFRENVEESLAYLVEQAHKAEKAHIDLLLFPEGFLQGYLSDEGSARRYAYDLRSKRFKDIVARLAELNPVLVFGLIELSDGNIYNSAAVVEHGNLLGTYRKNNLLSGESVFTAGESYPLFEVSGLKFGINICYDMQFPEASMAAKHAGAGVILCPANNMMRIEKAEKWKHRHHEMRIERAKETGLWIVSADVTGERDGKIGYGPTSVISPDGEVTEQVPLLTQGMVTIDVPVGLE